ncbi:MAG TPA: ornithine cyclodeaminase family protein [Alphaproteobacteria bacterium]|nr:ornithine cyclodeaminase family protein [Alphaproteobacteria bacterium]
MCAAESIPYLSEKALARLGITTSEVIESIEALIFGSARSTVWSAPKAVILPEDGRYMMAALAAADDPALLAVKTVVLNPRNPNRGLPQINGLVTLLDSDTGLPAAILDGNWITAVRTAGLSAVAAKHMARPGSSVLAFIGAGVQARSHLAAFADMYPLEEIRIFGRGPDNIERLRQTANASGKSAIVCASGKEAMTGADLIVSSVTYSATLEPFLDADWLKPGSFAAITDLAAPWKKDSFAALDRIVIDDVQQEAALPNKLAPPDLITGDLTGLVLGKFKGRARDDERSAFIFRGYALGDLALSALAYRKAGLKG